MFQIKLILLVVIAISLVANTYAKHIEIEPRIQNGQNAERGQFPFYVYLEVLSSLWIFKYQSGCGATLIHNQWVLTAGHCVSTKDKAKTRLHFGSLRAENWYEPGRKLIEVSSKNIYQHPDYSSFLGIFNPKNDIALIKLPSAVEFNEYIKSIPLACPERFLLGSPVVAVGNGITNTHRIAPILQYAFLRISGEQDNVIFAEGLSKESTKSGDSGGPLVALNLKDELNGLVGIVSFGDLLSGAQGFTRIASYFDWIKKTTGIETCVE